MGRLKPGPTLCWHFAREGYSKSDIDVFETIDTLRYPGFWAMAWKYWKIGLGEFHRSLIKSVFLHDLRRLLPEIQDGDLSPGGSGVRAQAVAKNGRLLGRFQHPGERRGYNTSLTPPHQGPLHPSSIGNYIVGLAAKAFDLEASLA